jgi:3',5'-cyclic AMP phosphodiesterase CpdA
VSSTSVGDDVLIAQITDLHIVEPGQLVADRVDTAALLAVAVDAINALDPPADLVLATGDLVNDGTATQYAHLVELLDPLVPPLFVIPGNHDDRTEIRRRFPQVGDLVADASPSGPIDYVVDGFDVRLVGIDTVVPGEHGGTVTDAQLDWLVRVLSEQPDQPTLVFQHHPPFRTGIAWMDAVGLDRIDAEASVIGRHRQVVAVVSGHIHRLITTRFAGTIASCWPSTGPHVALELGEGPIAYSSEPAGFAVHHWHSDEGLRSHLVVPSGRERWTPIWANTT